MDTMAAMTAYYTSRDEDSRLKTQRGSVEFLVTMHYIQKYLKSGMRILEIGAGTGVYSHELARMGYKVDAVELVEHNIEVFRENTAEGEDITVTQGDARVLSAFGDEEYDMVLLLGPMYHLFTHEDRVQAISETIRVAKKGGIVMAAYCGNDATVMQFCFMRGMIKDPYYKERIDADTFKLRSDLEEIFVLYRKEDVDSLMAGFDIERLHYIGTDLLTKYIGDTVESFDDETFELYIDYCLAVCEREDMIGFSNHTLDIFRKRDKK